MPNPTATTLGGIESIAAVSHNFLTSISTSGVPAQAQPACADISNAGTVCTQNTGTSGANVPLLNGNNTDSGNDIFSGSLAVTATSTPTQAAGTLGLAGTATKPTLGANSEGDVFLTSTGGFNIIGQGSTNDWSLFNKSGTSVCTVATGTTTLNCTGLQVGGTNVLTSAVTSLTGDGTYITNSGSTGAVTLTTTFGTAAQKTIGTSGSTVPLLNTNNDWGNAQYITQSTPSISTSTFTPDFSASNHFIINLVHASCPCTLANPTNIQAGQSGVIAIVQSASGSDLINTYGTDYIFTNTSAPTLSTAISAIDYFSYYVEDSTHIRVNFIPAAPQSINVGGVISNQTKFTTSGCSVSSTTGGATAGKYTSGTTGTCTVTITMNGATGLTAPNGWSCSATDLTTAADALQGQTGSTQTTATISGTTVSGDVVSFFCMGF